MDGNGNGRPKCFNAHCCHALLIANINSCLSSPYLHPTWQDVPTWLSALLSWGETVDTPFSNLVTYPFWIPNLCTMIQTQEFDCPIEKNNWGLGIGDQADRTKEICWCIYQGPLSIPIPSVRSIMYGRLTCLYICPKKIETQIVQYSTFHLWVSMNSACFSSFEPTMLQDGSWLILPGPNG